MAALPVAGATVPAVDPAIVQRHDGALERLLRLQVTDPASPWRGACPDDDGLYMPGSASAILESGISAFLYPGSKHHRAGTLVGRLRLAAEYL